MGTMKRRKSAHTTRSRWSRYEIDKLVHLASLYGSERVNFEEVARHLFNRSASDVKKRWIVVRDHLRRKLREHLRAIIQSAMNAPYHGELHPHLKWVDTQWEDLVNMNL